MTDRIAKQELSDAVKQLEYGLKHIDSEKDFPTYNLTQAMLHICRAIERVSAQIDSIESHQRRS